MKTNISHKNKFIYLAVPRTASRLTYTHLKQYGCIGGADNGGMTHRMVIHPECKDYLAVVCARNPFTRWVSYWNLVKKWPQVDYEPTGSLVRFVRAHPMDFEGFTKCLMNRRMFCSINAELLVASPSRLFVLRFEDLQNTFNRLPFVHTPHKMRINHQPNTLRWRSFYTKTSRDIVVDVHNEDFKRFGYSTNLKDCVL